MLAVARDFPAFPRPMRLLVAFAPLLLAATLHANTIVVDDASSGSVAGKCTIQDAVAAANTNAAVNGCTAGAAGTDTIQFASGIASIALAAPMAVVSKPDCAAGLAVTEDLTIDGGALSVAGTPAVTIARSTAAGTPLFNLIDAFPGSCANPATAPRVTVSGITLRGGDASGKSSFAYGGAIAAAAANVIDSVIDGNRAPSGGGLFVGSSLVAAPQLIVTRSTISNNTATSGGFGGGGINVDSFEAVVSNSSIVGNTAGSGGGILAGSLKMTNSTVSGNGGGGLYVYSFDLRFATITNNTGAPGLYLDLLESAGIGYNLTDTVIAGNSPFYNDFQTSFSTTVGTLDTTKATNVIGTLSAVARDDVAAGVLLGTCSNLGLAPLAANGGITLTHALQSGSCLIDAGSDSNPFTDDVFLNTDQRGNGYARFVGLATGLGAGTPADIGAFECQSTDECPAVAAAVNGACGSDNGQVLLAAPTNLCSAGTPSIVGGSGHPWAWSCAGSSGGTTATCSATIRTWTVGASENAGGSVSPATQNVDNGATARLTGVPNSGYTLSAANGCGGSLTGNVYTTAAVVADCSVSFTFLAVSASGTPAAIATPALSPAALVALALAAGLVGLRSRRCRAR